MIRRPPRSTLDRSSAASDVYKRQQLYIALLFFAVQLYADFSGYCDIAIGTARLFGIKLSENFNRPYLSKSIAEYWNRWHITLTSVSYTHLRAHETVLDLVCRLLLEKKHLIDANSPILISLNHRV